MVIEGFNLIFLIIWVPSREELLFARLYWGIIPKKVCDSLDKLIFFDNRFFYRIERLYTNFELYIKRRGSCWNNSRYFSWDLHLIIVINLDDFLFLLHSLIINYFRVNTIKIKYKYIALYLNLILIIFIHI